jgi:23S rRNA (uridine2552-2'-O)-methyltransferase
MRGSRGGGDRRLTERVRTAKSRSPASARWLERQLNDPYVAKAKEAGYRSRAAFKLVELDQRYRLLSRGARVVDLGAAPGGWTQVAVAAGAARVVAIDLLPIEPIAGATVLQGDFLAEDAPARVQEALGGQADLVLSDMAANTSGHAATDHIRIMALAEVALDFAISVLAPGGGFVCKLFQGGGERPFIDLLKRRFAKVAFAKPPASRRDSSETYVVAQGFRPGT